MSLDVNRLRQERVYETRAALAHLAADLASIERLAVDLRGSRKRLQWAGAGALVAGVIGLAVYFPVGLVLIALGIFLFFRVKTYPKAIANGVPRCELGRSLSSMLVRDADSNAQASLRLAFEPEKKLLSEIKLPHRKNGKQKLFRTSWFSLETSLQDGSSFSESVDDLIRERSFTNPRGKSKTKTRTRSLLAMRLAYRPKTYGDLSGLATLMRQEIKLPPSASMKGLEVTDRAIKAKVMVNQSGDLAHASSMLALGVYRVMNLSREMEARKRAELKRGGAK